MYGRILQPSFMLFTITDAYTYITVSKIFIGNGMEKNEVW